MSKYVPNEYGDLSAVDPVSIAANAQMPAGDLGAAFAKMILSLLAIILLLLVSYWFIRKLIQGRLQKSASDSAIQILEKRVISPKTMLYLVKVDEKKVLLAESHLEIKRLESFHEENNDQ